MSDLVALGGLFLLSAVFPAYLADARVLAGEPFKEGTALLGLAGALGVGSLISLTGTTLWNLLFPYSSSAFVSRLLMRLGHSNFRAKVAEEMGTMAEVRRLTDDVGRMSVVLTGYEWNTRAPDNLRGWVARRRANFSQLLNAATAIWLGLLTSLWIASIWTLPRSLATAGLLILAAMVVWYAWHQRKEAEVMEELWLRRNALMSGLVDQAAPSERTTCRPEPRFI